LPLAFFSGLLLAIAGWRLGGWRQIFLSSALTLLSMVSAAVLATLAWTIIVRQRNMMGIAESYLYLAAFLIMSAVIGSALARLTKGKLSWHRSGVGVTLVWSVLGLASAFAAPGTSYLFSWPSLLASLTLLLPLTIAHRGWPLWTLPALISALVVLTPAIDTFYQLAQPRPGNPDSELIPIVMLPVLMMGLLTELFRAFWVNRGHLANPQVYSN
jgi:hypothetical protein